MGNAKTRSKRLKTRFTKNGTRKAPDQVQGIKKTGPHGAGGGV